MKANVRCNEENGRPPVPHVKDADLADGEARGALGEGEGYFSIAIRPGAERVGELHLSVEFHGRDDRADDCVEARQRLLEASSEWLREVLEELSPPEAEWDVRVDAPPDEETSLKLAAAVRTLRDGRAVEQAVAPRPRADHTLDRGVEP